MSNKWSKKQESLLIELYPDCYQVKDLVNIIGRSIRSIYQKARSLSLKRNTNIGNKNLVKYGHKSRFEKGNIPWNKDIKGLQIGGKETQFKGGNVPNNTKHFGKPYLVKRNRNGRDEALWMIQKLGSGKRMSYPKYLWGKEQREIPSGYIIFYINGINDTKPPIIDDLGLMSRQDNMNRNTIHRYPEDIKKSIRILSKLNKTIQNETD